MEIRSNHRKEQVKIMKKRSVTAIKKGLHSYIREVKVVFNPLNTERIKVGTPAFVAEFLQDKIGNDSRENFILLCVNNKNEILSYSLISIGTISEAIVHPREVFLPAIMTKASAVIVCHNHPTGHMLPSRQDIDTTRRLAEAGKVIGIPLLDHIIVGFNADEFYSMKENGYIN